MTNPTAPVPDVDVEDLDPIDPSTLQPMEDDQGRGMSAGDAFVADTIDGPRTLIGNYPTVAALGVDISNYDHTAGINWAALYASGRRFVWVKIGEGTTYYNPSAAYEIARARAADFVVGGYWFCQPGNGGQQAKLMLSLPQTPKGKGDLVPIADAEVSGLNPAFMLSFTNQVKATLGCWAGSYSSRSYFQGTLRSGAGWEKPGSLRWIAAYNNTGPGVACDVWQNSSTTTPPGMHRLTDTDKAYTPLARMTIGANGGGVVPTYVPLTAAQITAHGGYKGPGDPPVYGVPDPVVIHAVDSKGGVHHSTWDARLVPADRCPQLWNGSGTLPSRQDYLAGCWVDFLRELLDVQLWLRPSADGKTYSWAAHFGIQKGGKNYRPGYMDPVMCEAVKTYALSFSLGSRAAKDGLVTPQVWGALLGQRK